MSFEMSDLVESEHRLEDELREIAERHDLNHVHLREIVRHSSRGLNQSQIAERTGVSRNTVRKYLEKMRNDFRNADLKKLVLITSLLFGGIYLLEDMVEN